MIPKIIHYCWFGNNPKSELIKKCMDSWHKYCPEYEIKEWNETNIDNFIPYMQEAFEAKKWAFVSDVARLYVVWKYGGIYLDTDVELCKSLDEILEYECFFAFENERMINTGQGFGAVKEHPCIEKMLKEYDERKFIKNGKYDFSPCPALNTEAIIKWNNQIVRNGVTQKIKGVLVLSCGDYDKYAKHYANGSWVEGSENQKKYKDSKIKRYLRNHKAFEFIEKYGGKNVVFVYTFLVYDLFEYGLFYFVKRFWTKRKCKL